MLSRKKYTLNCTPPLESISEETTSVNSEALLTSTGSIFFRQADVIGEEGGEGRSVRWRKVVAAVLILVVGLSLFSLAVFFLHQAIIRERSNSASHGGNSLDKKYTVTSEARPTMTTLKKSCSTSRQPTTVSAVANTVTHGYLPAPSASYLLAPSASYLPAPSAGYLYATSARHLPASSARHLPPTSARYLPATSAGYLPTPSASYLPTPSASYLPTPSASYLPAPSASYLPAPSASYLPAPSASYLPTPSASYLPAPSAGYLPTPSASYLPAPSASYLPAPSASYLPAPSASYLPASSAGYLPAPSASYLPAPSASYLPASSASYLPVFSLSTSSSTDTSELLFTPPISKTPLYISTKSTKIQSKMSSPSRILNPEISGFSRNNILTSSMSLGATLVGVLSSEASEVSVFITLPLALETHSRALTSHVSVSYQQTMDDPITSDSRKMEKATSLDNTNLATEYLDKPLLEAGNYTQANTGDVTSVSLDWGRPGTSQVDVSNNHPSMTSYALFGSAAASPWSQDFGTSSEYWLMASQGQHVSESTLVRGRGDILISPSYPSALLETTTLITSNQLFNTFIESSTRKRTVSVNRQLTSLYGSPLHNTKDMMSQPLSVSRKGLSYITAHGLTTSSLPLYGKYDNPFHTSEGSSSTPMHINSSVKPLSLSVAFKQSVTPGVDKSYSAPRSGNISLALNLASSRTSPLIIDVRTNTASPVVSHRDAQLSSLRVTMSSDIFISQVLVERYPTVLSIVTSSSIGDRLLDFVDSKDSQVTYSSMFWSAHMSGGSTMATPSLTSLPPSTAIDQTSAIPFSESENRKTIEDEDVRTFITSITSIENQYSARLEDRDQSLSSNLSDVMILSLQSVTTNEENRSKTTSSPFGLKSPVSYSLQRYKDSTNKRQCLENTLNTEIDSQVILLQTTTSANLKSDMASWSRGSKAILETMMPDALIPAVLSKQSLLYSMKPSTVDEIGAQPVMTATPSCTSPLVSKSQGRLNDSKEITRFGSIVMTSTYTRVSTNGLQSIKTYEDGASHVSFDSEELSGAATSVIKPTTSLLANHTSIKKHSAVVPETREITEPTKHSSTIAPQSVFLLSNTAEKYTILDFETLSLKVSSPMLSLKSELQISTAMSPMMYSPSLGHTRNTMKELISTTTTSDSTQKAINPLQIINLTKLVIGTTQSTSDIIYVSTTNSPVNSILFWLTTTTVSYPSLHKSRTPSLPSLFSSFHKARTTSLLSVFSSFHKSRTTSLPSLFSSFHKSRTPSLPSLFSSFHKSHTPSLPSLFSSFHKSRTPSLLSLFSSLHKARTTSLPSLFSSLPHPPPSFLPSRVFSPPFSSFPTFSSPISLSSFSSFISHTPYITPPSSSMLSGSSQQTSIPTVQYTRIDGSLKLTNVEFHPNLTNTANVMFKTLAEDVERTIAAIYSSSFIPAQEVKVESFEKGSVVVYFYVMLDSRVAGYYSSEKLTSVLRMSNSTMWRGYRVSDVTMVERAAKPQSAKRESSGVDDGVTIAIVLGFICSAVLLCIVIYMLCSHKKRLRKGKVLPVSTNDYGKDETKVPRSQNAWIHEPQFVENESAGEWITLATKGNYAQEEIQDPTKDNRLALEKDHKDTYSTLATYPGNSQSTLEEDYVSSDPTAAASHTNARVTLDMRHTAPVEEVITATREQHHYNANDIDFDQMFAPSAKLVTFLEETESPSLKDGQVRASTSDHVMPIKPIQAWFDVVPLAQMGSKPSEEQVSVTDLEQKVGIERKLNKLRQREIIRRESQRQALAEQKATPLY